jgi:nitrite reductase/ring-hydroxylating ferredoxin subunit
MRWQGQVHAYLNRCATSRWRWTGSPNRFFDDSGQWLLCSTHGAVYRPTPAPAPAVPCRGGLVKIALSERDGVVHWHTAFNLQPLAF